MIDVILLIVINTSNTANNVVIVPNLALSIWLSMDHSQGYLSLLHNYYISLIMFFRNHSYDFV